jgi:hypothetical protein
MSNRNSVPKLANAKDVSLNSPIPQTITSAEFDLYLNEINSDLFTVQESFTWFSLADAAADTATIVLECPTQDGVFNQTITMRVGALYSCRATRILTGTDVGAIINVGVGN